MFKRNKYNKGIKELKDEGEKEKGEGIGRKEKRRSGRKQQG